MIFEKWIHKTCFRHKPVTIQNCKFVTRKKWSSGNQLQSCRLGVDKFLGKFNQDINIHTNSELFIIFQCRLFYKIFHLNIHNFEAASFLLTIYLAWELSLFETRIGLFLCFLILYWLNKIPIIITFIRQHNWSCCESNPVSVEVKLSFVEPGHRWAHSPSHSKAPDISYQGTMKTSVRMFKTSGGL